MVKKASSSTTASSAAAAPTTTSTTTTTAEGKATRRRKPNNNSFQTYIFRVLRQVSPDSGISKKCMNVLDSMMNEVFHKLAVESLRLARYKKSATVSARDVMTACRILLPGQVSVHAISEATKAVTKYQASAGVTVNTNPSQAASNKKK